MTFLGRPMVKIGYHTMVQMVVPSRPQPWACVRCRFHTLRWLNVCPSCRRPYSFEPVKFPHERLAGNIGKLGSSPADDPRVKTRIPALDKFLGGGLPRKLATIIFGYPSCGKSTLTLQMACSAGVRVLYVTGEEKNEGLDARARRCGFAIPPEFSRMMTDDTDAGAAAALRQAPDLIIVDSLQMIFSRKVLTRAVGSQQPMVRQPGSPPQMLYMYKAFMEVAEKCNAAVLFISHADEHGGLAATMKFLHMLDSVCLHMFRNRDPENPLRALRVVKSRSCAEGVQHLTMTDRGLRAITRDEAFEVMEAVAELKGREKRAKAGTRRREPEMDE